MTLDAPARIAVIGSGPIGLEAALYGRFLGYEVDVYERGGAANNVRGWSDQLLHAPFHASASSLGLAALHAQHDDYRPPDPNAVLTGAEFLERYLIPLSQTDLLIDRLLTNTRVVAVGESATLATNEAADELNIDAGFTLQLMDPQGERRVTADAVVDASGTPGAAPPGSKGRLPSDGEVEFRDNLIFQRPSDQNGADVRLFVIGEKSVGPNSPFLIADGLEQIQRMFCQLVGRLDLDLYANMRKLLG